MAEEGRNVEAFLRYIPTQLDEAQRNLHSDNTNVLEFIQRRLEDSLHVLNVLVRRCTYLQIDECDNLLRHLISEVQQMDRQYDDLNSQSRILSEDRFCCPREDSVRGRPRYSTPNDAISGLHRIHRSWKEVSANIGVLPNADNVPCPNTLWWKEKHLCLWRASSHIVRHIDGHHKLIQWRMVTHGGIDGFMEREIRINRALNEFAADWNNHPLSTEDADSDNNMMMETMAVNFIAKLLTLSTKQNLIIKHEQDTYLLLISLEHCTKSVHESFEVFMSNSELSSNETGQARNSLSDNFINKRCNLTLAQVHVLDSNFVCGSNLDLMQYTRGHFLVA
ncbi:Hypothetical predicted protein, partial [Paramuricea clavata]